MTGELGIQESWLFVDSFKLRLWVPIWYPDPLPAGVPCRIITPPFTPATCQLAFASKLGVSGLLSFWVKEEGPEMPTGATLVPRHASKTGRVESKPRTHAHVGV